MWEMHDIGAGWWIVMSLGMLVFWGLVIWTVMSSVRGGWPGRRPAAANDRETAAEALDRRLARGEITTDEYEELRETLLRGPSAHT